MLALKKSIVILFSSLFFYSPSVFSDTPKTLVFSAIPDQDETRLKERFNPISDYLSKKLDIPVKYVPVKSYEAVITAFRNNQASKDLLSLY